MLDWFRKRDYRARLEPAGVELVVRSGERLLDAALAAGLAWPHDCRVGSCGTCRCVITDGRTRALTDLAYTLEVADIRAGTVLACQCVLKSDVTVQVALDAASAVPTETVDGTISACRALTHDIVELEVALERTAFAGARAGQYLDVAHAGLDAPRSYSLARAPAAAGSRTVTFFVRHVPGGAFTDWLFGADRCGTALTLAGPYGDFHRRAGTGRMLCVAGGSGLAPIHALVEAALAAGVERDCTVLFGARTQADLYDLDELRALGARWHGAFELLPMLSDEPAESDWSGARGLVTSGIAPLFAAAPWQDGDEAYLCGPPAMVDAAIAALGACGMPEGAIFFDKFLDASTLPGGRAAVAAS
ncbi:MAG: 2Fe-2S iron-sulfur cluster binding domain-containing protein [Gammaproteobacteria bacterium]|nr:2Fe-2S iron-sulfur cluster binding domain-containing protein [Gammaproteobacteria bacterium]MCP5200575.1 2Fe-2S iron-sulfur cluster binding domain-containing protein [Gammaproteobacteria bacterium]